MPANKKRHFVGKVALLLRDASLVGELPRPVGARRLRPGDPQEKLSFGIQIGSESNSRTRRKSGGPSQNSQVSN